jgi:hypothetical protein
MLLAAENAEGAVEVIFTDAEVGSKVLHAAHKLHHEEKPKIGIKEFAKIKMEIKNHEFLVDGKPVLAGGKEIKVKIKDGKVR